MNVPPLLGMELLRLHPLAFLGGMAFGPAESPEGAELILGSGARRGLKPLCTLKTLALQARRRSSAYFVSTTGGRLSAALGDDALFALFQRVIAPRFDALIHPIRENPTHKGAQPTPAVGSDDRLDAIPPPVFPQPALVLLGRIWFMRATSKPSGIALVRPPNTYALTGDHLSVHEMTRRWRNDAVKTFAESAAASTRAALETAADPERFADYRRRGFLEDGDLVLLMRERLLGHVIPPHYNVPLGMECRRTLGVFAPAVPADRIPGDGVLRIGRRTGTGWEMLPLLRFVCLGNRPDALLNPAGIEGVLRLPVFLRFAAFRIAANGRFHESDTEGELCRC